MKKKPINSVSLWFRGSVSAFSKSSSVYNYFHITPDPELAVFFAGKGFVHVFTVNPGARRFKLTYKNLAEKLEYPKIAARMLSARTDLMTFMDQDLAAFKDEFRKARSTNNLRTALEEFMYDTGIDEDMGKNAAQFSDADVKEFRKWLDGVYGQAGKSGASSLVSVVLEDLQSAGYDILDLDEEESIVWNSDVLSLIASIPTSEFKMKLRALARNGLPVELFRFKKLFPSENEIDSSKQNLKVDLSKQNLKETFMKKPYTRKQIQEAIAYWKKQLMEGNYSKVNEEAGLESGRHAVLKVGAIGRWNVFDENGNFIKAADSIETLPALIGQLHIERGYDTFEFGEDIRNSGRLNSLVYHDGTFIRGKKDVFDHIAHEIAKWAFDECGELPASTLSKIKVSEYGIVWKN